MGLSIACIELDPKSACPYIARGDTMDELLTDLADHAKTVHGYTDEQINDPKMQKAINAVVKQD
jgi:predicted small metal-binding protein